MASVLRAFLVLSGVASVLALWAAEGWAQRAGRRGAAEVQELLNAGQLNAAEAYQLMLEAQDARVQEEQQQLLEQLRPLQQDQIQSAPARGRRGNSQQNVQNNSPRESIDTSGRMLSFDIQLLHLFSRSPIAESTQQLQAAGIQEQIARWQTEGLIARFTSGRVAALEGNQGRYQTGEVKSVVQGFSTSARGGAAPSMIRDNSGVIFLCTGRIRDDGKVVVELSAEDSWYEYIPGDTRSSFQEGVVPELVVTNPNIAPMGAPKQVFTLSNRILGVDGETQMVHISWSKRENGYHGTLLLLTPRIAPE